jgi:hypothetical protein
MGQGERMIVLTSITGKPMVAPIRECELGDTRGGFSEVSINTTINLTFLCFASGHPPVSLGQDGCQGPWAIRKVCARH